MKRKLNLEKPISSATNTKPVRGSAGLAENTFSAFTTLSVILQGVAKATAPEVPELGSGLDANLG